MKNNGHWCNIVVKSNVFLLKFIKQRKIWAIVYEKHFNAISTKMRILRLDRGTVSLFKKQEFRVIVDYTATTKKMKARGKRVLQIKLIIFFKKTTAQIGTAEVSSSSSRSLEGAL